MDHSTYLKELAAAYQGEVRGEAGFTTLADHAANADEREVWQMLARLERTTREQLIPLMEKHGLDTTPDEAQRRLGRERGEARIAAGFAATVGAMTKSLQPYLTLYARLEAEGPPGDRAELAFLNAHEVALHEFAIRAAAGDGREALQPVRTLLGE
ncbi:MAG: hypothetical protein AB7F22_16555 [Reyranella sp.]|uniref:hypothetical protein n=1 Tax=Reyranella sp. TaxID=1929291 RepID=UPI003D0D1C3C